MKCFNCGYILPSNNLKECPLCGMKHPVSCYACKSPNPVYAKFCFNCGNKIDTEDSSSVQNYNMLQENRRNVAVMFADVSGFTALSEKLDPEEVREIINDTFYHITKPVYELEGTIDKYIGDCVMILFGAQHTHSDDPKRAVLCGIEMMKLIKEFSEQRLAEKGLTLDLSIGINYGLVVTGSVGNYYDKDYTVMGDIVNTAQRLQTVAGKGEILVSESIYIETKDTIEYINYKELNVKNKKLPVKSYTTKGIISLNREHVALIDREKELKYLDSILNDFSILRYAAIIGEAGLGKTSLINQFLTEHENKKKVLVTCSPIYQNRVYYVISNIVLNIMNLKPDDSNRIKVNRLKSYVDFILKDLNYTEEEIEKNYNFLSLLIGLERDSYFQDILNAMDYSDIEREMLTQLAIFITYSFKKSQYIIVVDDLQWADKSSINLLLSLIKELQTVDSLFVFASRYELDEFQQEKGHVIKLNRLDRNGVKLLAARALQCENIDSNLLDIIFKYTNGNPLYVKEFITAIIRRDSYYVEEGTAYFNQDGVKSLPNTIESLILSNLQDLEQDSLEMLQLASVMGKDFNLSWLNILLGKNLDDSVFKLPLKLNIISLKAINKLSGKADKIYTFNQDTIREVIYESILNKTKIEYHRRIGDLIESNFANELDTNYEILSIHYNLAGNYKKATEYYYKTAFKYKIEFKYKESLENYFKYLDLIKLKNIGKDQKVYLNALNDIGYIYYSLNDYNNALEYYSLALKEAIMTDDTISIKLAITSVYKELGEFTSALSILEEIGKNIRENSNLYGKLLQLKCSILSIMGNNDALELAEKSEGILLRTKDFDNLAETMSQAAIIYFSQGEIDSAIHYLNKATQYAESNNNLRALIRISGNLGIIYYSIGLTLKALEYFNKSISLAKQISNASAIIAGNINLGILYLEKGQFDNAERLFMEAFQESESVSLIYQKCVSLINLGELHYERGDYAASLVYYNRSIEIATKHGLPIEEGINYLGFTKIKLELKDYVKGLEMLEKAYSIFNDANEVAFISDYYRYRSNYELLNNNLEASLMFSDKSIEMAEAAENNMKILKALRLKGNILARIGDYEKAIKYYNDSIAIAERLESAYELAKGYFRRYSVLRNINSEQAEKSLLLAAENIRKVDSCRWSETISMAMKKKLIKNK